MGQLCTKCVQLLYDFAVSVKTLLSGLLRDIRECLAQIADCPCLKRKNVEMRQLYKPVLHPYEEETAQDFLQHIERGERFLLLNVCQPSVLNCLLEFCRFA